MNTKYLTAILVILGALTVLYVKHESKPEFSAFENWKTENRVSYDSMFQDAYREKLFLENLKVIELHNSQPSSYKKGVNQFTAMTQEEFTAKHLGLVVPNQLQIDETDEKYSTTGDIIWTKCFTNMYQHSGHCGASYAFLAAQTIQFLFCNQSGKLIPLSKQQIVDCSISYGNHGCNGGLVDNSFRYIKDHGIVTEDKYPYIDRQQACAIQQGPFKISGFTDIRSCNELANAIQRQPISVVVDASNWSSYHSGVFDNCSSARPNHGALLIGIKDGNWIVRVTSNTSWGESGNIRLAAGNTCGICSTGSFPRK